VGWYLISSENATRRERSDGSDASGYLLETNVISEVMKPRPARSVAEWIETTPEELLYLGVNSEQGDSKNRP
jgi:hypothetical protein